VREFKFLSKNKLNGGYGRFGFAVVTANDACPVVAAELVQLRV
jgi:hypothetical protein